MSRPTIQMKHYADALVGKKISKVRNVTQDEADEMMWFNSIGTSCVIEFTDGTYAIVESDAEGNGAGFLYVGKY